MPQPVLLRCLLVLRALLVLSQRLPVHAFLPPLPLALLAAFHRLRLLPPVPLQLLSAFLVVPQNEGLFSPLAPGLPSGSSLGDLPFFWQRFSAPPLGDAVS